MSVTYRAVFESSPCVRWSKDKLLSLKCSCETHFLCLTLSRRFSFSFTISSFYHWEFPLLHFPLTLSPVKGSSPLQQLSCASNGALIVLIVPERACVLSGRVYHVKGEELMITSLLLLHFFPPPSICAFFQTVSVFIRPSTWQEFSVIDGWMWNLATSQQEQPAHCLGNAVSNMSLMLKQ